MEEKVIYNKKEITLGSISLINSKIYNNILSHFNEDTQPNKNDWYFQFNSEPKEMKNFIDLTEDKKVLLDIGSQFGSFSLSFLSDSVDKKAYAFDGGISPFLVMLQTKFINNLQNFYPFNFLIGDKDDAISCYSEELQSLAIPGNDMRLMFKIDTVCDIFNITPDVIKIDIEGAEVSALHGSINTIINNSPIIFIEVHPKFMYNYNSKVEDIVNFVNKIEYDVLDLNRNKVSNYLDILNKESTDSNRTIWVPKQK